MVLLLLWVMMPTCLSTRFTLLVAMPNTSAPFSVGRIGAAALIAIDAVNNSTEILPGQLRETRTSSDFTTTPYVWIVIGFGL